MYEEIEEVLDESIMIGVNNEEFIFFSTFWITLSHCCL